MLLEKSVSVFAKPSGLKTTNIAKDILFQQKTYTRNNIGREQVVTLWKPARIFEKYRIFIPDQF